VVSQDVRLPENSIVLRAERAKSEDISQNYEEGKKRKGHVLSVRKLE
jgi:hypothetical protein